MRHYIYTKQETLQDYFGIDIHTAKEYMYIEQY